MALDDQTAWDMTDEDTTQGGSNVLPGGIVSPAGSMDINGLLRSVMAQQPVQLPSMPRGSPSDGTSPGWLGLLGEALAGGQSPLYKLRGAQEDTAGSRALLNFGINMMLASGPSPVKPSLFSAAAQGLQGAQQSMDQSQQAAYTQAGQQFEQQRQLAALGIQQQDARIKQLAAVLPLLRLQGAAGLQSPFGAPGTTPAGPGNQPLPTMPPEYEQYFQEASKLYNIPVDVLKAQAAQESRFNPNAKGATGGIGIMQVQPSTAAKPGFGVAGISNPEQALLDPRTNIMMGAAYLRGRAGNADLSNPANLAQALTAYNGGGDPNYAANVLRYMPRATAAATPPTPAPFRVASNAPVAPPTATTAPATTTPAPAPTVDLTGPRQLPPVGTSTPYATPATIANTPQMVPRPQLPPSPTQAVPPAPQPAPPTTPSVPPSPTPPAPTAPPAPPPPPKEVPDEQLSLPQYIAKYKQPPTPEQVRAATVGGDTAQNKELADQAAVVQNAQEAADKAKQTYDIAQRAAASGITGMGDVNKSLSDLNTANAAAADAKNKYNQLVQQADTATASNLVQLDKTQTDQLSAAYKDMLDRQQKAALQTQAERAAVSKSGQDVAFDIDKKRLDNMTDQASSAHTTAINLQSMASIMNNLPTGGEADVMAYLSPSQTAWLRDAGIISGDHADAAAVFNGLKNYLSVQMRPVGSGALRGAEMDRFQASLPDMLTSPAGRQKALAFMQAYVNRVQQESDFATDYYSRPGTAGAPAYNLRGLNDAMNAPKSQGGLGEVIPHAPPLNAQASEHSAFMGGIERGAPYYGWQQNQKSGQWEQQLTVK